MLTTSFPRFPGDYAGIFIYAVTRGLAKNGIEVKIIAPQDQVRPSSPLPGEGLRVYRFAYFWPHRWQRLAYGYGIPTNVKRNPWLILQGPFLMIAFLIAAWRACKDCQVIHIHWAPLAWIGLAIRRWYRIPVVVTVHGTDVRSLPAFLIRPALKRVDAVITAALETEELIQKLGIQRYHTIPLPIDEEKFQPEINPGRILEETGLSSDDPIVTFVARLEEFKDPLTLVKAAPRVHAKLPNAQFLILGDGPLAPELSSSIFSQGLQEYVHMYGARSDVERFLAVSKLFVALSPVNNAWSVTIAEAMWMKVPCIITRAGQTEKVFTHLENAYLIEPKNEIQLSDAIINLLADPDLRQRLVEGASELLMQHGKDSDTIIRRTIDLYSSLISLRGDDSV